MKRHLFPIIVTLLCIGCTPANKDLIAVCGDGIVKIIDLSESDGKNIKTKEILCYAHVPMAHSADLLPGNRIAVALSTHKKGNALEIYDVAAPEKLVLRDSLYSGHGVVWNEKRQSLYALGYKELREYKLENWDTEKPALKRVKTWEIPMNSGQDRLHRFAEYL